MAGATALVTLTWRQLRYIIRHWPLLDTGQPLPPGSVASDGNRTFPAGVGFTARAYRQECSA